MEGLESIREGRSPSSGLRATEPEGLYGAAPGAHRAPPSGTETVLATGWFEVAPDRALSFGPFDFDVLVFPAGPVTVEPDGGPSELLDPNLAVFCRRGTTCWWAVPGRGTVRCGLLSLPALRDAAPRSLVTGALPGVALDPMTAWTFPATVYLAQKRITADVPWRSPSPIPHASERPVTTLRWFRVMAWGGDGRRRGGSRLVRQLRRHLSQHLGAGERLSEIAESLGYSEGHLSRCFKEELGVTIHAYRHELRMRVALDLLPFRSGELSDLAVELGYASHSHFTARFLRTFGVTPSSCRKLLLGQGRGDRRARGGWRRAGACRVGAETL